MQHEHPVLDGLWSMLSAIHEVRIAQGPLGWGAEGAYALARDQDLVIVAMPRGLRMAMETISSKTQPFQKASTMWFSSTSRE